MGKVAGDNKIEADHDKADSALVIGARREDDLQGGNGDPTSRAPAGNAWLAVPAPRGWPSMAEQGWAGRLLVACVIGVAGGEAAQIHTNLPRLADAARNPALADDDWHGKRIGPKRFGTVVDLADNALGLRRGVALPSNAQGDSFGPRHP